MKSSLALKRVLAKCLVGSNRRKHEMALHNFGINDYGQVSLKFELCSAAFVWP